MPPVTLTPIVTGLKGPIGIDYHEPTDKVVISVNHPTGQPHNFELVDKNGTHAPVSPASGFKGEIKIASVRSGPHQGGFTVGQLFVGSGPGVIARISEDLGTVMNPWVTLPGEKGLLSGLFQDRYGVFGGDLIVVTDAGNVWRVTSAGVATKVASLGVILEGVTTVPNDPTKYGPWAAKIVAGGESPFFYAIDASGNAEKFDLDIPPEDIDIIPAGEQFFGVDYDSGDHLDRPARRIRRHGG